MERNFELFEYRVKCRNVQIKTYLSLDLGVIHLGANTSSVALLFFTRSFEKGNTRIPSLLFRFKGMK